MTALINRIIDHSGVDGCGIRTVLVFQGCNFRCRYCHSPDTMGTCNGCGVCALHCSSGALKHGGPGKKPEWFEDRCTGCGRCVNACRKDASPRIKRVHLKEVTERIRKNRSSIEGITCSGGECTIQADFMTGLFPQVKEMGLSCLIDSNGAADFERMPDLMEYCDGVMLDIKAMDREKHVELTGAGNEQVLHSAKALARMGKLSEIRTVVSAADSGARETVDGITRLLKPYGAEIGYRLIPFRVYGVRREYRRMGAPSRSTMEELRGIALANGFKNVIIT
jgi:pyruvate formate lyase activating enzyme